MDVRRVARNIIFCIAVADSVGQMGQCRREWVVRNALRIGARDSGKEWGGRERRVERVWDIEVRHAQWVGGTELFLDEEGVGKMAWNGVWFPVLLVPRACIVFSLSSKRASLVS